jgi:2-hydroxychromene-2-carboxylate isomerase
MLTVTRYFTPLPGYAYLGYDRLCRIAAGHGAAIASRPVDIMKAFAGSGTTPPAKQSPVRLAYRKADLVRCAKAFGVPVNPAPRHWPVPADAACKLIIAGERLGGDAAALSGAIWTGKRIGGACIPRGTRWPSPGLRSGRTCRCG